MKKFYFTLFPLIIVIILVLVLYFIDIPSPSKSITEDFKISIK